MDEHELKYRLLCKAVLDALPAFAEQVDATPEAQQQLVDLLTVPAAEVHFDAEDVPSQPEEAPAEELAPWDAIREQLSNLQEMFETRLQTDAHKNRLFDELHREVIGYRNGATEKNTDSMAMDIVAILDYLTPCIERLSEKARDLADEESAKALCAQLLGELDGLQLDLTSVLDKQGVEPFTCDTLDPKHQRILSSVTQPGDEDRQIIQHVKPGYTRDGRLLRKEQIKVIRITASQAD